MLNDEDGYQEYKLGSKKGDRDEKDCGDGDGLPNDEGDYLDNEGNRDRATRHTTTMKSKNSHILQEILGVDLGNSAQEVTQSPTRIAGKRDRYTQHTTTRKSHYSNMLLEILGVDLGKSAKMAGSTVVCASRR